MPPMPYWSKSFVATYIYKHRKQQTRYEIDTTLLQGGHSPEEIEAAWQLLTPTYPIPIRFRLFDFLLLFGSLVLGAISLFFPGLWPFVNFISPFYTIIALISLAAFIAIIFWGRKRKRAGAKGSILLVITNCILGLIFAGAFLVSLILSNYTISHQELATTSVQGHDYHLLYAGACLEGCMYEVALYKCSFFNLICPEIYDGGILYSDYYTPTPTVPNLKNIGLKVEPGTGKIFLLDGDRVVYTFKNV